LVGVIGGVEFMKYMGYGEAYVLLKPGMEALCEFLADQAGDITAVGLEQLFTDYNLFTVYDVDIDPSNYRLTIIDLISLAFPIHNTAPLYTFLEQVGFDLSDITLYDPITITPDGIAEYSFPSMELLAKGSGNGSLNFTAWRFESKLLGFYLPVTVSSNTVNFTVQTNGTIHVTSNLSNASWTISGPKTYTGSGTSKSYPDNPSGDYTITWNSVSDYTAPDTATKTLTSGGSISFSGTYTPTAVGILKGLVRDGYTHAALSNVNLRFYKTSDNSYLKEIYTDANGQFSIELPAVNVYADVSRSGYVTTRLWESVKPNETVQTETILFAESRSGKGTVSGRVTNAMTAGGVGGAKVVIRSGVNSLSGSVVAETTANSSGDYQVDLDSGTYTAEASASSFINNYAVVVALGGTPIGNQNISISPVLSDNYLRIVLTWGASPGDLDSHLTGPDGNGVRFHLYYPLAGQNTTWGVKLDVDDTSSYGPETITISTYNSGTYRYSVHDYTNMYNNSSTALSNTSDARVQVFEGSTLIESFNVPTGQVGTLWTVFELDGDTRQITPINTFTNGTYASEPNVEATDVHLMQTLPEKKIVIPDQGGISRKHERDKFLQMGATGADKLDSTREEINVLATGIPEKSVFPNVDSSVVMGGGAKWIKQLSALARGACATAAKTASTVVHLVQNTLKNKTVMGWSGLFLDNAWAASTQTDSVNAATLDFTRKEITVTPNEIFETSIRLSLNAAPIGAYKFVLRYDPQQLEMISAVSAGSTYFGHPFRNGYIDNTRGRAVLVDYQGDAMSAPVGDQSLVTLKLRAKTTGSHKLVLYPIEISSTDGAGFDADEVTCLIQVSDELVAGDINGDGNLNLTDAMVCLRVMVGFASDQVNPEADVDGDGKIGMAEVVYILQHVAGF
ncbi:MAG: cohesin domain-containing protein, partial [Desulfatirhabdiaceae bacterium]